MFILTFFGGYLAALWTTVLDPSGLGGSVLALPAILVVTFASLILFTAGAVLCLVSRFGLLLIVSSILLFVFFLVSAGLVRL